MQQIYRPDFVLSHFVHYSTITRPMTEYYEQRIIKKRPVLVNNHSSSIENSPAEYTREIQNWEWADIFLNEPTEGCLVHTRSIVPHETMFRSSQCRNASQMVCPLGFECPDSTLFVDLIHTKNLFHDPNGNYCNCWINQHLEKTLIPLLEA